MRNHSIKKGVAIAVILLFIGLAFAPSINANVRNISKINTNLVESHKETINVCCRYFTLRGIEEIEKEVLIQDYEHLSQLMDGSNIDAIVYKLDKLHLLPEKINIEQSKDLLSGEYGKQHFEKLQEKLKLNHFANSNIKRNIFCNVSGNGVHCELSTPVLWTITAVFMLSGVSLMLLDFLFRIFPWYPLYGNYPFYSGPFFFLAMSFVGIGELILESFRLKSQKEMPLSFAILEDSSLHPWEYSNVNTSGLLGKWWIRNHYIHLNMIGFLGLWITYDGGWECGRPCEFKGFALYVNAWGYNN